MSFLDFLHPIWKRDIEGYQYSDNLNKSVLSAIENSLSQAESDVIQSKTDSYLAQATGVALDLWGQWFGIYRQDAEPDTAFRSRILYNITVTRGTISAIIQGLENYFNDYTGDIQVYEPYKNIFYTNKSFLNGDDHFAGDIYNYAVIDVQFSRNFPPDIIDIINLYKPAGVKVLLHYIPNKYSLTVPTSLVSPRYIDSRQFLRLENGTEDMITGHLQLGNSLSTGGSGLFMTNVSYLNGADVLTGDFSVNRPTFNYSKFSYFNYLPASTATINSLSTDTNLIGPELNNDIYILTMSPSTNETKIQINAATNLVTGTAFTDLSQWTANNAGHYVIDTTNLCNGNNSLKISTTASTYDGVYNPQNFILQPNTVYTMSFWAYISASADIPSGKVFRVYVIEGDSSGAVLNYHVYAINNSNITPGTWGKYTLQFTTAGTANHGQFRADFLNVAGTAQIWLSTIKVETGSTATPWSPAPEDTNAGNNLYFFLDLKTYMTNFYTDYMATTFPNGATNQDLGGLLNYAKLFLYFHAYVNGGSVPHTLSWYNFTNNSWEIIEQGNLSQTWNQVAIDLNKAEAASNKPLYQFVNQQGLLAFKIGLSPLSFTYNIGVSYFDFSFKKNLGPADIYQMTPITCL